MFPRKSGGWPRLRFAYAHVQKGKVMSLITWVDARTSRVRSSLSTQRGIFWSLRLAVGACFIGHGAFGIITKADWLPFFAFTGIPEWLAWRMMPVIGTMDIT